MPTDTIAPMPRTSTPRRKSAPLVAPPCSPSPSGRLPLLTDTQLLARLGPLVRAAGVQLVADAAGVSQPALSAWLGGRKALGAEALARVAVAVGHTLDHGYRLQPMPAAIRSRLKLGPPNYARPTGR